MKTAYIVVEVRGDDNAQLRRSVGKIRRALHDLSDDVPTADLPYYEEAGPKWGAGERLANEWPRLHALFAALPWRRA